MSLKRNTYVEIDLSNLKDNIKKIINTYNNYDYYFGVVKADNYGHGGIEAVRTVIDGGCNYLAVATLDEALSIREEITDIPIICIGSVPCEYINLCIENNITITIYSLLYMEELKSINCNNLKAHIKINTGMNRLGVSKASELKEIINIAKQKNIVVEGIYTHLYDANKKEVYEMQLQKFKDLISAIDISKIKIIHISASDGITNYEKPNFVNGCRLGIIMYGFTNNKVLGLHSTFSVWSEVIQINTLNKNDTVGYGALYKAENENEKIAVIPIGYADGIIRKNTGRYVYINDKKYKIVGNICMDMLFVKVDNTIKVHDKVLILKDVNHINEVAKYLDTIPYEVICSLGKRVTRIYKK